MLILSDDIAKKDLIGHQDYRDGILQVIKSVKSDGSFTIGIFGNWGTGKTSFLKQLKESINKSPSGKGSYITTWFNPWQFTEEKHLIIPFFHILKDELEKETKRNEKLKDKIKKLINELLIIPDALLYGMEWKLKLPFLDFAYSNKDTLDRADKKTNNTENQNHFQEIIDKYERTYYNLLDILKNASKEFDTKIIVFIDDLDRCLPEKAVQLIEGLKVLMDLPNFIFVLGVSRNVIEQGVRLRYSQYYNNQSKSFLDNIEENYLDKIIQFPFTLPAAEPSSLKNNLLKQHLKQIDGLDIYTNLIHDVIGNNPRTLKRFFNTISFTLYIAEQKNILDSEIMEAIVKLSLLAYLFPSLYRQIENSCIDLVKIESIIFSSLIEPENRIIDYNKLEENKTGLKHIDRWLDNRYISKISQIVLGDGICPTFKSSTNVLRYIHLLSSSVDAELESKESTIIFEDITIRNEINKRLAKIPKGSYKNINIKSFAIDKYLMTQALYERIMLNNPSIFKGDMLPVENVSWHNAIDFCNKLSEECNLEKVYEGEIETNCTVNESANGYRLPFVEEWEYACLGKKTYYPSQANNLENIAWFNRNAETKTHVVGEKEENGYGLYDMLGNVYEWCYSEFNEMATQKKSDKRFMKGGSWAEFENNLNVSHFIKEFPQIRRKTIGFRVVRNS